MKYTIKDISEIGIFVGLALILNLPIFSIHIMGGAGSISFSIIPLCVIAIRKSWWKSLIASGVIYGLFACLMDGYGFICYPLDYLCAYGSCALISIFSKKILKESILSYVYLAIAVILFTLLRLCFSTISGIWIYEYTFIASLSYNVIYILPTGSVTLAALLILLRPLQIINFKYEA